MAKVSTCLVFVRQAEAAFQFYKSVFKTEFSGPIMRLSEVPRDTDSPPLDEADKNLVMHVALPILGGHMLQGNDCPTFMSDRFVIGTNMDIGLEPDTRAEAERLFHALSEGGTVDVPLQEMFWGAYFGSVTDQFGVAWRINCVSKE